MRVSLIAAIFAAMLVLGGCGKADSTTEATPDNAASSGGSGGTGATADKAAAKLVGTWHEIGNPAQTSEAKFNEDGTFSIKVAGAENPAETITMKGAYVVEGDSVTRTFTEFEIEGVPEADKAASLKAFEEQKGKPRKGKMEWTGESEIKFTDEDGSTSTWKKD